MNTSTTDAAGVKPVVTSDAAKPALVKGSVAPSQPVINQARLAEILTNLDAVTKAIINRYGIHPEAEATEAAAVFLRELIKE